MRRLATFVALLLPAVTAAPQSRPVASSPQCAVLDLELPTRDSMVAFAPGPTCGPVRLVVSGLPRRIPRVESRVPQRLFEIAVALENIGTSPIPVPYAVRVDSATPIQHGRQLAGFYFGNFGVAEWVDEWKPRSWTFRAATAGESSLRPGQRGDVQLVQITTFPLSQRIRIWLSMDALRAPIYRPVLQPPGWHPRTPVPLGDAVTAFVRAADFTKPRGTALEFHSGRHDLRLFSVAFGEGQDCPMGCFYSSAVGLQYGKKIGWIGLTDFEHNERLKRHIEEHMFSISAEDTYLLSQSFLDTVSALHGRHGGLVDEAMLPMMLKSPYLPRARLVRYAEGLYSELDRSLASLLIGLPRVQADAELLTLLANLPFPYNDASDAARQQLRKLAPGLIARTSTSARTLCIVATMLSWVSDTSLRRAMAAHPNVRRNPATLTVLATRLPRLGARLDAQLVAAVRAPERIKKLVAQYIPEARRSARTEMGWALLRDPVGSGNEDVLTVLANGGDQDLMWAASRRLPEGALRCMERPYIPLR